MWDHRCVSCSSDVQCLSVKSHQDVPEGAGELCRETGAGGNLLSEKGELPENSDELIHNHLILQFGVEEKLT